MDAFHNSEQQNVHSSYRSDFDCTVTGNNKTFINCSFKPFPVAKEKKRAYIFFFLFFFFEVLIITKVVYLSLWVYISKERSPRI